jgi:hypothetical protein
MNGTPKNYDAEDEHNKLRLAKEEYSSNLQMLLLTSKKESQSSPHNKSNIEYYSHRDITVEILDAKTSKRPVTSIDTFSKPRTSPREQYDDMHDMLIMQAREPDTPK